MDLSQYSINAEFLALKIVNAVAKKANSGPVAAVTTIQERDGKCQTKRKTRRDAAVSMAKGELGIGDKRS